MPCKKRVYIQDSHSYIHITDRTCIFVKDTIYFSQFHIFAYSWIFFSSIVQFMVWISSATLPAILFCGIFSPLLSNDSRDIFFVVGSSVMRMSAHDRLSIQNHDLYMHMFMSLFIFYVWNLPRKIFPLDNFFSLWNIYFTFFQPLQYSQLMLILIIIVSILIKWYRFRDSIQ